MKIRSVDLKKFGCFTDVRLDFSRQGSTFHVIYGNNEAGKSTALRAISGFLYSIPVNTPDAFQHEMKDLRIAAELEASDGTCASFVRRKGQSNTLLDCDGKPLPDASLAKFLGGTAAEIFSTMFRLDHPSLVRGGSELLEGKGQLAESLFQAGTGITKLRQVVAELEEESNKLFKPRSPKSQINAAIDAYAEVKEKSRTLCVIPKQWIDQKTSLASKEQELLNLKTKLSALREKKERLTRFQGAIPLMDRRKEYLTELEALVNFRLLGTSARDREAAQRREQDAIQKRDRSKADLSKFELQLQKLPHQPEFLAKASSINHAYERLDSYRSSVRDLPIVQGEQNHTDAEVRRLLDDIQPGSSSPEKQILAVSNSQRTRVRTLADKSLVLQERLQAAVAREETTKNALRVSQAKAESSQAPQDTTQLRQTIERIRKRGDLDAVLRDARRTLTAAQELAKAELARLNFYDGTLENLELLKVPSIETIDVFETSFTNLKQEKQILATQKKENDQRVEKISTEINALKRDSDVPTENELSKSRERRQHGWQLVRAAWLESNCTPEQISSFDPIKPLPEAYEQSVLTADAIADRLRRESDRVTRLSALMADLEACQNRQTEVLTEEQELTSRLEEHERQWRETWKQVSIVPKSPKEMRAWLAAQKSVVAKTVELRSSQRLVNELQDEVKKCTVAIRNELERFPSIELPECRPLSELMEIGDQHVVDSGKALKAFDKLIDDSARLEVEHSKTALELKKVQDDFDKWSVDWKNAVAPLNLGVDTRPDEALAILETLESIVTKQGESAALQIRIDAMTALVNSFNHDVSALMTLVKTEPQGSSLDDAVVRLHDLLTTEQNNAVHRENVLAQLKVASENLEAADAQILDAQRSLQTLMGRANCSTIEALQEAELKSDRRRELEEKSAETLHTISELAAGVSLEEFLKEISEVVADQLPFDIEEMQRETDQLDQMRSHLDQDVGKERAVIASTDTTGLAALAADDAHNKLATVRAHAERHVLLQLAKEVLRLHIDRFREQNQDPIVKRASELFPRLTAGSFSGLTAGFDEKDRPILLGVRPNGEEVDVKGMSDGTRDQLFLSLRLASLERQLAAVEPLPLIVDDILVNFDDDRAKVTLQILGELSQHTQVLFFTHHTRLKEIATSVIANDRLTIATL